MRALFFFFFFNATAPTEIYTLSLHDALPISLMRPSAQLDDRPELDRVRGAGLRARGLEPHLEPVVAERDRKSTRLNSSHQIISYAVFCLKKKKSKNNTNSIENR